MSSLFSGHLNNPCSAERRCLPGANYTSRLRSELIRRESSFSSRAKELLLATLSCLVFLLDSMFFILLNSIFSSPLDSSLVSRFLFVKWFVTDLIGGRVAGSGEILVFDKRFTIYLSLETSTEQSKASEPLLTSIEVGNTSTSGSKTGTG